MSKNDFEKLVKRALVSLPKHIRKEIDNLAIVIEKRPSQRSLLGLYQGVPKTSWGRGFGQILPDKITIFQEPIEKIARSEEETKRTSSLLHLPEPQRRAEKRFIFSTSSRKRESAVDELRSSPRFATARVIKELIRLVVWHEIAHHFGFSEKKVRELEDKWRKKC